MELPSDGKAAVQAAIAGQHLPTSPNGGGTDQNIDCAGFDALVSAFVVDARCELVISEGTATIRYTSSNGVKFSSRVMYEGSH